MTRTTRSPPVAAVVGLQQMGAVPTRYGTRGYSDAPRFASPRMAQYQQRLPDAAEVALSASDAHSGKSI